MDKKGVLNQYNNEYNHFYICLMYICIMNECNEFAPGARKQKVEKVKNILNDKGLVENIRTSKAVDFKSFILKELIKLKLANMLYILKSK